MNYRNATGLDIMLATATEIVVPTGYSVSINQQTIITSAEGTIEAFGADSTIVSRLILPFDYGWSILTFGLYLVGLIIVYIAIGVTESVIARYRMDKVPQFILTSFALAFFATIITLEFLK